MQTPKTPDDFFKLLYSNKLETIFDNKNLIENVSVEHKGELYYVLAMAHFLKKNHTDAISYFNKAKIHNYFSKYVLFNQANSYRSLKDYSTAIYLYKCALKDNPKFPECLHNLALAYIDLQNYQFAKEVLDKLIDIPEYYQGLNVYGNFHLFHDKNISKAIEYFEKYLKFEPKNIDVLNKLGVCYDRLNDSKAILFYRRAINITPIPTTLRNLANILNKMGKTEEAIEYYKKYLAKELTIPEELYGYYDIIRCYQHSGDLDKAFNFIDSKTPKIFFTSRCISNYLPK